MISDRVTPLNHAEQKKKGKKQGPEHRSKDDSDAYSHPDYKSKQISLQVSINNSKGFEHFDQTLNKRELAFDRINSRLAEDFGEDNDDEMKRAQDRIDSALAYRRVEEPPRAQGVPKNNKQTKVAKENEKAAIADLAQISDSGHQVEQKMLQKLESTKKQWNQQVSTEFTDTFDDTDKTVKKAETLTEQLSGMISKNKLSVDPLVFPAARLEAISSVKMATIEKEHKFNTNQFKTPRKSNKNVWAPINSVFA